MRFCLIACEVVYREICLCTARSRNIIDIEFVGQGLHDAGSLKMCGYLQELVDRADAAGKYDAVLLGYGLCNNGLAGLRAGNTRIVVPKAHDCITLFLGSKERYREYFDANPGTYFETTGWMERDHVNLDTGLGAPAVKTQLGLDRTYEDYVRLYGEENAKYIVETLSGLKNYRKITYIEMNLARELGYDAQAEARAKEQGLDFEKIDGDMSIMRDLVDGNWDDGAFLVVNPGEEIRASNDGAVMKAVAASERRESHAGV